MHYNEQEKELIGEIELPERGWSERIMNVIIWGHPEGYESDRSKINKHE